MLLHLIRKIAHEQRWTLLFTSLLLGVFFTLGTYLYVTFGEITLDAMSQMSPELLQGLFGGMLGAFDPLESWLVTLFLHPLLLSLFSVVAVAVPSRSLAGEIDRGTVDLLLAYPVARWQMVAATAVVVLTAHAAMTVVLWGSMRLGLEIGGIDPPASLPRFRWVALNLFALFTAVGGVSLLVSACDSSQGRAIGRSLGFILVSFFANVIASLWDRAAWIDVASVFHYMQPQPVVAGNASIGFHLGVLFGLAAVCIGVAFLVFIRRDIHTV